jgi:hypothetical protein
MEWGGVGNYGEFFRCVWEEGEAFLNEENILEYLA